MQRSSWPGSFETGFSIQGFDSFRPLHDFADFVKVLGTPQAPLAASVHYRWGVNVVIPERAGDRYPALKAHIYLERQTGSLGNPEAVVALRALGLIMDHE